jgi:hypothetical protein
LGDVGEFQIIWERIPVSKDVERSTIIVAGFDMAQQLIPVVRGNNLKAMVLPVQQSRTYLSSGRLRAKLQYE